LRFHLLAGTEEEIRRRRYKGTYKGKTNGEVPRKGTRKGTRKGIKERHEGKVRKLTGAPPASTFPASTFRLVPLFVPDLKISNGTTPAYTARSYPD
jgi:hypothetical protein